MTASNDVQTKQNKHTIVIGFGHYVNILEYYFIKKYIPESGSRKL